jgi:hypothetical protein
MSIYKTKFGGIWTRIWSRRFYTHSIRVDVGNQGHDVEADIALQGKWAGTEWLSAICGITRITHNGTTENFPLEFDRWKSSIYRRDVTSVTFTIRIWHAHGMARWKLYYWN